MKFYQFRKRFIVPFILIYAIGYSMAFLSTNVEVDYVFKVCPVFTIYTDKFIDDKFAGINKGIYNIIRPENRYGTVKIHEMKHGEQAYRTGFMNLFRALYDKKYLAKLEAEAYATEIENKKQIPMFASMIKELYAPNVSLETIDGYIRNYFIQIEHNINDE
jgi:hypothetical protein